MELFSEQYYKEVVHAFGYDPIDFGPVDTSIGEIPLAELRLRYLCQRNLEHFAACATGERVVVTGFGMSGPPHLGTIAQLLRLRTFGQAGEDTVLVLGDLDAYNGRNVQLAQATDTAHRFKEFALALGVITPTCRAYIQSEEPELLHTSYLLSRHSTETDLSEYEEDLHQEYVRRGKVSPILDYPRRTSLMLMVSDFILAGQSAEAVLSITGIDEHKYVLYAEVIRSRMGDESSLSPGFQFCSLYNRIFRGFNGHIKMSKSFPESGITVETTPDKVRERVLSEPSPLEMTDSLVFQLMEQTHFLGPMDLERAETAYRDKGGWSKLSSEFVDYLNDIIGRWPRP